MKSLGNLCTVLILAFVFGTPHALATPQGQGGPPQPWKKSCSTGTHGGEGCTVTVEMRVSPQSPCDGAVIEYCVKIKVVCPPDIPPGDPGETCEDENCEFCGNYAAPFSLTCDGQCFTAQPNENKNWSDVADDCGNMSVSHASGPCT